MTVFASTVPPWIAQPFDVIGPPSDSVELILPIDILPQPNDWTCGPTCLHAVYRFWGTDVALDDVVARTKQLENGGTLAVMLGCDALRQGFDVTICTFNLTVFDPTWFQQSEVDLPEKLRAQMHAKTSARLKAASQGYLEFLELGGRIVMRDLNADLILEYLDRTIPIITGLSSTYLYQESREVNLTLQPNDILGVPQGHFVVLRGFHRQLGSVRVADPFQKNPWSQNLDYELPLDRVICSILLGVLTYDANLLIIQPSSSSPRSAG